MTFREFKEWADRKFLVGNPDTSPYVTVALALGPPGVLYTFLVLAGGLSPVVLLYCPIAAAFGFWIAREKSRQRRNR